MIKKILVFLYIIFLPFELSAQNTGKLRGFLTDKETGEALAFGNVFIKELGLGASTNAQGLYFITGVPGGKTYTVTYSYVGYKTEEVKVFIAANRITQVDVALTQSSVQLGTIEKIGRKTVEKNAADIGLQRITVKQLETMPQSVEADIFRTIQTMPGVRYTGDISARYYVRGGASNQNLVLLNGSPIYNPFHAFGMFSVIDPEIMNSAEFYKGGFPAEYGGRLSSILKISTKDGNKNRFSAKGVASFLTAKALLEGPIPHGSFIVSGRRTYSTRVLKKFLNGNQPPFEFYDFSAKLTYANPHFIPGSKFTIQGFSSKDRLLNENLLREDFSWTNNIFSFNWFQIYTGPLYSDFTISFSQFLGELIPNFSRARPKKNKLDDVFLHMNFTYLFDNKNEIEFGMEFQSLHTILKQENQFGIHTNIDNSGAYIGFFTKYKLLQFETFGADVGLRANLKGLTKAGDFFVEPRVNLTYNVFNWLKLKASWGVYQQEITTVSEEAEVITLFEPYIIIPDYLPVSRAVHYIAGLEIQPLLNLKFKTEAYYKKLINITAVNDNKKFLEDKDLLSAQGEAYGAEFELNYSKSPFLFSASYSLAWAYKVINGWRYVPRFDARHSINLSLGVDLGKGWKASAMWIFGSGLPYTQIIGYYDKLALGDFHNEWYIYDSYLPYAILGDRNLGRLPDYHRLDFSMSKKFDFNFVKIDLDFSILNVYNRKNIFYFQRDTGEIVNMLPFLPTATIKVTL